MSLRRLLIATAFITLAMTQNMPAAHAQQSGQPMLHRGTNLSCWLANAKNRQSFGPADFQRIKKEGFDFVRLPVNPEFYGFSLNGESGQTATMNFTPIDTAIRQITAAGLTVILDIHPGDSFMKTLERSDSDDRFVELWSALAARYKNVPSDLLAFELLNEPQFYNRSDQYNQLMAKTVQQIRQADPNRLLIIEAPAVTSVQPLDQLNALKLINDPNVAYDTHFYQPYIITHQGISSFGKRQIPYFLNLPYPSRMVDKSKIKFAPGADHDKAMAEIDDYVKEGWDKNRINSYMAPAAQWAQQNKVRLLILEYGVLKDGPFRHDSDPGTRERWLADVTSTLESLPTGVASYTGRAVWDESDNFGIDNFDGPTTTDPHDGSVRLSQSSASGGGRHIAPGIAKALGLTGQ